MNWCASVAVLIYKKCDKSTCGNQKGINSICVGPRPPAGISLRVLSSARERCVRENQTGFILRQILERGHIVRGPIISDS